MQEPEIRFPFLYFFINKLFLNIHIFHYNLKNLIINKEIYLDQKFRDKSKSALIITGLYSPT